MEIAKIRPELITDEATFLDALDSLRDAMNKDRPDSLQYLEHHLLFAEVKYNYYTHRAASLRTEDSHVYNEVARSYDDSVRLSMNEVLEARDKLMDFQEK